MSKAMRPAVRLRQIADQCLSGDPIDGDLANWLGASLQRVLSRDCATVDEALGLKYARGGVPWWLEEAIRERDAALRCLADEHFSEIVPTARAKVVYRIASRYAASGWRCDRDQEQLPCEYIGTVKEFLWAAFKSGATMPIGERHLRNILSC